MGFVTDDLPKLRATLVSAFQQAGLCSSFTAGRECLLTTTTEWHRVLLAPSHYVRGSHL